jgi:antirestriction protein ArdC
MTNNPNQEKEKVDVYALVTNRIIELLNQGTIPWRMPWTSAGVPMNLLSKRPYRGVNVLLLNSCEFEQNLFLTFKQIKTIGGSVKKGEKGNFVVFTKILEKEVDQGEVKRIDKKSFLRYYKVFNLSQCNDIPEALIPVFTNNTSTPISECENVLLGMRNAPEVKFKENGAFYVPSLDYINMPKKKSFKSMEDYYGVLFHELIHSTGHSSRLNRKEVMENHEFGTEMYSIEELVAEIGSCYLKLVASIGK